MGHLLLTERLKQNVGALTSKSWMQYFWLFLITLAAAALRIYKLGDWSFWIDEIFTVNHALAHFSTPQLILEHLPPNRNWVPISVILTAQAFNAWGVNELSARLTAAVIGIITVPVLYFPIRKMFNTRVALITVLLLAVSPWHIDWSQNARGYTSLMLFYSLALFAFYFGFEKDRSTYLILFFVCLYLASSERLLAIFILPVLFLYLLTIKFLNFEKPSGLRARNIYTLLTPVVLFGIVQIYGAVQNGQSIMGSIFREIVDTFIGRPIENPFTQITFMVFKLGIPLFVLSFFSGIYVWYQRSRQGLLIALGAFVPFFLVVLVTPFMFTEERYAFVALPSWLILAGLVIDKILTQMKKTDYLLAMGILSILISDAMGANLMYFHTNHGNRRDWKSAFTLVGDNLQEGDVIVSTWPVLGNYYLEEDVLLWQDVNAKIVTNNNHRMWFVVIPDMAWYTGTEDFYWWVSHNTRMIKNYYLRTVDDANLEIYLYDPSFDTPFITIR